MACKKHKSNFSGQLNLIDRGLVQQSISSFESLTNLAASNDVSCQLDLVKKITADVKKNAEDDTKLATGAIQLFINIYLANDVKHPIRRVISSCLQSLPTSYFDAIENDLCLMARLHILSVDTKTVPISNLRHHLNVVNGLLDNFQIGQNCLQRMALDVLQFLTLALERFVTNYSPSLPPVEQNEAMHHCHVTLQTTNKMLQKCSVVLKEILKSDSQSLSSFKCLARRILTTSKTILKSENFLLDACCTAGMCFGLLLNFLSPDDVVPLVLTFVFPDKVKGLTICNKVPDWLQEYGSCYIDNLTLTSHLCVCHGLLGVLENADLIQDFDQGRCLLVDVMLEKLLQTNKSHIDTSLKLLVAKALLTWITRTCSIVETSLQGSRSAERFLGHGPVVQKLLNYVWTTWEEPVDALRLNAKQILDKTVKLHLVAAQSDTKEDPFLSELLNSLLNVSWATKGKYGPLLSLVDHLGANEIVQSHPGISTDILNALKEHALSCYASELYEKLCRVHLKELHVTGDKCEGLWEKYWMDPVLTVICSHNKAQKRNVLEYVLPRLLKVNKNALGHMIRSLSGSENTNLTQCGRHRLGALIMCLRRARVMGLLRQPSTQNSSLMFGLVTFDLFKQALSSNDDQVRLDALALLCENNKTTEAILKTEFDLIRFFVQHNLNNQSPSYRQMLIANMKKLFLRTEESAGSILRLQSADSSCLNYYKEFCQWLVKELFNNLFPGASFARTTTTLSILNLLVSQMAGQSQSASNTCLLNLPDVLNPSHVRTLIECFTDSFEENKRQAFNILTLLPKSAFPTQIKEWLTELFEAGLTLSVSTKPHNCTTAAYIFKFLIINPGSSEIILAALRSRQDSNLHVGECLIQKCEEIIVAQVENLKELNTFLLTSLLLIELKEQLTVARSNLLHAAANKPLYPTMHCIRYLMSDFSLSSATLISSWFGLLADLTKTCCEVAKVVSPVVHNSSPEGNIPVEAIKGTNFDIIDISKAKSVGKETEMCEEKVALMPGYLVVCCWRSIKEVSLLLGELVVNAPIIDPDKGEVTDASQKGLLTYQQVLTIGNYFITQLLESKHRGAFELAYAGFVQMMDILWRNPIRSVRKLPVKWLGQVMQDIQSEDGMSKLCATRRSAGVPFYVQAVLVTEPNNQGKEIFKQTMVRLLELALNTGQETTNTDAQVHALNILRALYRDTRLGHEVSLYVADGVKAAILGFISPDWAIRNSSTLLFSTLMTRIFGVKRSKDEAAVSKKNCLNGRVFFHRYPSLYPFLLEQLDKSTQEMGFSGRVFLHPGLYPVLLLLGRLIPSVMEGDVTSLSLAAFIPYIIRCASSSVLKTRLMAARALQPLVFKDQVTYVLIDLLDKLPTSPPGKLTQNHLHGILLQLKALVCELTPSVLSTVSIEIQSRLSQSSWISTRANPCMITRLVMLELMQLTLDIFHPPLTKLHQKFVSCIEEEIENNSIDTHILGITRFQITIATAYLNLEKSTFQTEKVIKLLSSSFYEVRLVALDFLISVQDNWKNSEHEFPIALWNKLSAMLIADETWNECLQKTLKCLSLLTITFGHEDQWDNCNQLFQRTVCLAENTSNEELKVDAIKLGGDLLPQYYTQFITKPIRGQEEYLLKTWVDLLRASSEVEQSDIVKLSVAHVIVKNAKYLLLDVPNVLGPLTLTLWNVAFDLLQEDDLEVKEVMTYILPKIEPRFSEPFHSMLTLDMLLGNFIQSKLQKYPDLVVRHLVDMIIKEDNSFQENDERLFDKGEMNIYKEKTILARLVTQHLSRVLIGPNLQEVETGYHGDKIHSNIMLADGTNPDSPNAAAIMSSNHGNAETCILDSDLLYRNCVGETLDAITDEVCGKLENLLNNSCDLSLSAVFSNAIAYEDTVSTIANLLHILSFLKTIEPCSRKIQIEQALEQVRGYCSIHSCNHMISTGLDTNI